MLLKDFTDSVPSKAGVYQFYVYPLNKYYIGESVNIRRRVLEHLNGNGKKELFRVLKEYGLDAFGFQVLQFESDRTKRISLEQHYKCFYGFDNLLNSISTKENGSNGKAVLAFTKEGKFHKRFGSLSEAASFVDRKPGTVSDSCLGKAVFVGGYIWLYESDYSEAVLQQRLTARKIRDIKKRNHLANLSKQNLNRNQKPVLCKNEYDEIIFMSITDASRYFAISVSNISACCLGKQKTIKNYEWSFVNE